MFKDDMIHDGDFMRIENTNVCFQKCKLTVFFSSGSILSVSSLNSKIHAFRNLNFRLILLLVGFLGGSRPLVSSLNSTQLPACEHGQSVN